MRLAGEKMFSENKPTTSDKVMPTEQATAVSSFVMQYARGELVSRDSRRPRPLAVSRPQQQYEPNSILGVSSVGSPRGT